MNKKKIRIRKHRRRKRSGGTAVVKSHYRKLKAYKRIPKPKKKVYKKGPYYECPVCWEYSLQILKGYGKGSKRQAYIRCTNKKCKAKFEKCYGDKCKEELNTTFEIPSFYDSLDIYAHLFDWLRKEHPEIFKKYIEAEPEKKETWEELEKGFLEE
jgi:hypothetical protein